MSADRRPYCGLADRVLSIFTASTGPTVEVRAPVNGCTIPGACVTWGPGAAAGGGAGVPCAVEQAARPAAASTVAIATGAEAGARGNSRTGGPPRTYKPEVMRPRG